MAPSRQRATVGAPPPSRSTNPLLLALLVAAICLGVTPTLSGFVDLEFDSALQCSAPTLAGQFIGRGSDRSIGCLGGSASASPTGATSRRLRGAKDSLLQECDLGDRFGAPTLPRAVFHTQTACVGLGRAGSLSIFKYDAAGDGRAVLLAASLQRSAHRSYAPIRCCSWCCASIGWHTACSCVQTTSMWGYRNLPGGR